MRISVNKQPHLRTRIMGAGIFRTNLPLSTYTTFAYYDVSKTKWTKEHVP